MTHLWSAEQERERLKDEERRYGAQILAEQIEERKIQRLLQEEQVEQVIFSLHALQLLHGAWANAPSTQCDALQSFRKLTADHQDSTKVNGCICMESLGPSRGPSSVLSLCIVPG